MYFEGKEGNDLTSMELALPGMERRRERVVNSPLEGTCLRCPDAEEAGACESWELTSLAW